MSGNGAYDSAWFQYPRNHHLAPYVRAKLSQTDKQKFIYISHEHKDHYDPEFLKTLRGLEFNIIVPQFHRGTLRERLSADMEQDLVACTEGDELTFPGGSLRLFIDDSGLNRDSAILVRADGNVFLNLNDCKVHDRLAGIRRDHGAIDVFAAQYSGATWHPVCYDYSPEAYRTISQEKMLGKFERVAKAIEVLQAQWYLPSAGPPCFLDPDLVDINFEPINIFPRANQLMDFFDHRLSQSQTNFLNMAPGEVLDVQERCLRYRVSDRSWEQDYEGYIREYARTYQGLYGQWEFSSTVENKNQLADHLQQALRDKLARFDLRHRLEVPLYFSITDPPICTFRVDFQARSVESFSGVQEGAYYALSSPAWQLKRVIDGLLTWEEFSLTFRARLRREPDVYQTLMQGFLILEPEDLSWFCSKMVELESSGTRTMVTTGRHRYLIDRYCPHQGGDLSEGWLEGGRYWTCFRHGWQFDLEDGGRCLMNDTTINAVKVEDTT